MRKADNVPPSCAVVTKSGNLNFLEPSRLFRACNGTDLPLPLTFIASLIYEILKTCIQCFRRFSRSSEKCLLSSSRLSVHPSDCISAAPTRWISVKFAVGDCYVNLWRKYKLGFKQVKISDTMHEDLSTLYCFRRH